MGVYAAVAAIAVGTVLSASAQSQAADAAVAQGQAQKQALDYQARSMDVKAGQDRAAAQRGAIGERRKEDLILSRSQAVAAASGAGASDPTVLNNEGFIVREGELGALTDLYRGEESARGLEEGAGLRRYEGAAGLSGAEARAGAMRTAAVGTLFQGAAQASTLYAKYNPSSPSGGGASGFDNYSVSPAYNTDYGMR